MPGGLTVAVTGPTGDLGRAFLLALEREPGIERVLGMARRPFDPAQLQLSKVDFLEGDVLDRPAVEALAAEADVLAHLAFIAHGSLEETRQVNLEGSRNVFAVAAAAPRVRRLVYTSSVVAYGFHADNPQPLTEDVPVRGSDEFYYSAQKAELEAMLVRETAGAGIETRVLRPCVVAGPRALALINRLPQTRMPPAMRRVVPVPDPGGVPFQLVHHDDAAAALVAATLGAGSDGAYNLAGDGTVTMSDIAHALGWRALTVPHAFVALGARAAQLPFMPPQAQWINTGRLATLMDTSRARRELGWKPAHDSASTLREAVAAARSTGLV
jgi:UDP-glucose 4-epimerase